MSEGQIVPSSLKANDLRVGVTGRARFFLTDGALIETSRFVLGETRNTTQDTESFGFGEISGTGTILRGVDSGIANIVVGLAGRGELQISNGAKVDASLELAGSSDGEAQQGLVNVSGAATRLNGLTLTVADRGAGEMNVSAGANVTYQTARVGLSNGSHGLLNVSGEKH